MKPIQVNHFILRITLFFSCFSAFCQMHGNGLNWQLVWEDNFNTFNPNIWKKRHLFDGYGGSGRLVYLDQNVSVNNGRLVLTIKQEDFSCPSWAIDPNWSCVNQHKTGLPYLYTSGLVESKQAYNIQFGYIEARIKVPFGYGFWPAFWVYIGEDVQNPANVAEIDIFEILEGSYHDSSTITTNYHLNYPSNTQHIKHTFTEGFSFVDWHTYALEWSPSKIVWYLDDIPFRVIPNPGIVDPVRITFNISSEPSNPPISETPFPSEMLIDYVRVYQLNDVNGSANQNAVENNFHSSQHPLVFQSVCKNITLGNQMQSIPWIRYTHTGTEQVDFKQ